MDSWLKIFGPLPSLPITDIPSLEHTALQLHKDMDSASSQVFSHHKAPDPQGVCWWNPDHDAALTFVHSSSGASKKAAITTLCCTIAASKHKWAYNFLHHTTSDNLWEATAWQKGHSIKRIPPLLVAPHCISDDLREMMEAFKNHFFVIDHPEVNPFQADNPDPLPPHDLAPITQGEITSALSTISNKLAPGLSGINYQLIKWAFRSRPNHFLDIFNATITLGHHPQSDTLVVIIPKPAKPNYSLPKAYYPPSP